MIGIVAPADMKRRFRRFGCLQKPNFLKHFSCWLASQRLQSQINCQLLIAVLVTHYFITIDCSPAVFGWHHIFLWRVPYLVHIACVCTPLRPSAEHTELDRATKWVSMAFVWLAVWQISRATYIYSALVDWSAYASRSVGDDLSLCD